MIDLIEVREAKYKMQRDIAVLAQKFMDRYGAEVDLGTITLETQRHFCLGECDKCVITCVNVEVEIL